MLSKDDILGSEVDPAVQIAFLRGESLSKFRGLENALCMMLHALTGLELGVTFMIFYNIVNTRSRSAIFESLLSRNSDKSYKPFWKSLLKEVNLLTGDRNRITHWTDYGIHEAGDNPIRIGIDPVKSMSLVVPSLPWRDEKSAEVTKDDLVIFCDKSETIKEIVLIFSGIVLGRPSIIGMNEYEQDAWQDIFRKPFLYPIPENYPLSRNRKAP